MEIKTLCIWDGQDTATRQLAQIALERPGDRATAPAIFRRLEDWLLLQRLKRQLQPLADRTFGGGTVLVRTERVADGSVVAMFALIAAAKVAYGFIKDYKSFKEGLAVFVKDVKKAETTIVKIVEQHFPSQEAPKKPARVAASLGAIVAGVLVNEIGSFLVNTVWCAWLNSFRFLPGTASEVMARWISHNPVALTGLAVISLLFFALGGAVTSYMARRSELGHAVAFWFTSLVAEAALFLLAPETFWVRFPPLVFLGLALLSLPCVLAGAAAGKLTRGVD